MKQKNGFTLIEVLVYLVLFAILMSGVVLAAYNMFELTGRTQTRAMLTAEGNFLLAKINWAVNGATGVAAAASPPSLTVTRFSSPATVIFDLTGSANLQLKRDSNPAVVLNNSNVKVQNFVFTHTGAGASPESITATFDLVANTPEGKVLSQTFTTTKYLRK